MTSEGVKLRAQIDADSAKGLLLVSGGGSVALLALLPQILDNPHYARLSYAIVWALLALLVSLVLALIHNVFRRRCSLIHEQHSYRPPPGRLFGLQLNKPTVCFFSNFCMWLSLVAFLSGGLTVFAGALAGAGDIDVVKYDIVGTATYCITEINSESATPLVDCSWLSEEHCAASMLYVRGKSVCVPNPRTDRSR